MSSSGRLRACAVFRLEGGIDLQQRGSLTLGKGSVRSNRCGDDFVPGTIAQESGLYVKCSAEIRRPWQFGEDSALGCAIRVTLTQIRI